MSDPRKLVMTRIVAAPPEAIWRAWTAPATLPRWFGPKGFSCRTKSIDLAVGGAWIFDMIGPDGTVYPNRHRITAHQPPHRLTYLLDGEGGVHDNAAVMVEVTITAVAGGSEVALDMTFADAGTRDAAARFGAEALGLETLDKLAAAVRAA